MRTPDGQNGNGHGHRTGLGSAQPDPGGPVIPAELLAKAQAHVDSGAFFAELATLVAYPTVSDAPEGRVAIKAYLDDVLTPALTALGCEVATYPNPDPAGGPFLVGTRVESPERPT